MKCLFKKGIGGLHPFDSKAENWMGKVAFNEVVQGEFKQPRNVAHHCKFFALLNLIYQNQTHYKSVDQILFAFKYHIGHGEWVVTRLPSMVLQDGPDGAPVNIEIFQPHSISFAKMDQGEFEVFYNKALDFVTTVVIPGLDKGDLERELLEFAA